MGDTTTATATASANPHHERLNRILFSLNQTASAYASKSNSGAQNEAAAQTAGDLVRSVLIIFSQATQTTSYPAPDGACYWDAAAGAWICPGDVTY